MDENFSMLKELIETKIDGLESKLDLNYELLENKIDNSDKLRSEMSNNILNQVTGIHERVNKLENHEEIKTIHERISKLENHEEIKTINEKIEKIDGHLLEVKMITKYPKIAIILLVALIIISMSSVAYAIYEVHQTAFSNKAPIEIKK